MPSPSFVADWLKALDSVAPERIDHMFMLAQRHADDLATSFYTTLMSDELAQRYLRHDQVKSRLHPSLQSWLKQMCDPTSREVVAAIYEHQCKIGDIHARIGIPVALVLKGARLLKTEFSRYALHSNEPLEFSFQCSQLFGQLMDLSMEAMSAAYASSVEQKSRSSEAYRLFSLTENLATERERQRAALLDWVGKFMFEIAVSSDNHRIPKIHDSEFGQWFRHKGMYAFQGVREVELISQSMNTIDESCLTHLSDLNLTQSAKREGIHQTRALADNILTQLNILFSKSLEIESGKDVMTGLLNRRFLPSILTREIEFSRQNGKYFSLVSIDIDHFKAINDQYGHEAGDQILVDMAHLINEHSRGGDFLFRMGGEEFLLVLVDIIPAQALKFAEKIRAAVEQHPFTLPNQTVAQITVSIGVTSHRGHPDYQHSLQKVDRALYQAKNEGRNQVCAID